MSSTPNIIEIYEGQQKLMIYFSLKLGDSTLTKTISSMVKALMRKELVLSYSLTGCGSSKAQPKKKFTTVPAD